MLLFFFLSFESLDNTASMVARIQVGQAIRGSIPGRDISSAKPPDPLDAIQRSVLCILGIFFWGKSTRHEDHSFVSSAEFTDDWSYDSTAPIRLRGLDRNVFTCTFQAVFFFGFPVTILPHVCYMTRPLRHPPRFGHPSIIWRGTQIMQLLITQFSPSYCYSHPP